MPVTTKESLEEGQASARLPAREITSVTEGIRDAASAVGDALISIAWMPWS